MWLFLGLACLILQPANMEELLRKRHLNPQGFMTIDEIISYWGYPSEQYWILTEDAYFLQANRIPHGVHSPGKTGPRPVVLLVHGFLSDGRSWIANLPSNSLGFALADAGYDVWIISPRGTTWSRRNLYFSSYQEEFWNFSFHEIGIYDVPATIDFILQKTKQDSLYYLAHSEGATAGFIAFSIIPRLAPKVKLFMALQPGYTLLDTKGLFGLLLLTPPEIVVAIYGKKEFGFFSNRLKEINDYVCSFPGIDRLCFQLAFTITGFNEKNVNVSRVDVYAGIFPDYTSVKTVIHWLQIFRSKIFRQFDYGSRNMEIYNMTTPPVYKIEDVHIPTALWYAGKDFIIRKEDMERLIPRIPQLIFRKFVPFWEHFECIWGLDAPERLYPDIFSLMQKYK